MFQTLAKYMHFPEKEVNMILAGSVSAHEWDGEDVEAAKVTASLFRKTAILVPAILTSPIFVQEEVPRCTVFTKGAPFR